MDLFYWVIILLFYTLNNFGQEHYFLRVFYTPLEEVIWLFFPFFIIVTLAKLMFKKKLDVFYLIAAYFLGILGGIIPVLFFNFKIIPIFVIAFLTITIILLVKKYIRLNFSLILAGIAVIIYFSHYGTIYLNWFRIEEKPDLKIVTFNLSISEKTRRLQSVLDIWNRAQPDVICLQEVLPSDEKLFTDELIDIFPYQQYPLSRQYKYQGGIILSRYPFKNKDNKKIINRFDNSSMSMNYVEIQINSEKEISLYNIHLISNGFGIRNAYSKKFTLNKIVEFERINYIKRSDEARNVMKKINFSKKNIMVLGDFNDVRDSKILRYFKRKFVDAWELAGQDHLVTFGHHYIAKLMEKAGLSPRFAFDFIGIDHALVSKSIKVISIKAVDYLKSDHRPVLIKLKLEND